MFERAPTLHGNSVAVMTRGEFLKQVEGYASSDNISDGLEVVCDYVGGASYLLTKADISEDCVVSSNWPYDLAKSLGQFISDEGSHSGALSNPLMAFEPSFLDVPEKFRVPRQFSRRIAISLITCGEQKFLLSLLFDLENSYSFERIRDVALVCAYHLDNFLSGQITEHAHTELTERETECLSWIAKGKTSDEIALIIGISRNTVNNYITSIMNKTATKSRAEAVAEAVRSELI